MKLSFLGAAGTVTGSRTLINRDGQKVLVDCGLFQGYKSLRLLNWEAFPFDPASIGAVVLTHAHLDHSGALPLLAKRGFRGPVFATPSTIDVCKVLLPDSARIQEEDAGFANRHGYSRHKPALALYTEDDAERALRLMRPLPFGERISLVSGVDVRLHRAGHILGASSVELTAGGQVVLLSGDLGRADDTVMREPEPIERADHLVVESTYGDRLHDSRDAGELLGDVIMRTAARGGIVLIPAFAVGRAQSLLLAIARLKQRSRIPDLPVYLNSPMAVDMTALYHIHMAEHRLSREDCSAMCHVAKMVRTVEDSRALVAQRFPCVIVSASGMATGGRVLHHLRALAPDHRNTIVFAGFQAAGTRGARMLAGERSVRIHGDDVPVRAEVVSLPGMSAHADASQVMQWLRTAPAAPRGVFLNHGEPGAADAMRQRIERELGWTVSVPRLGQEMEIA